MSLALSRPMTSPDGPHEQEIAAWCESWLRAPSLTKLFSAFGFENSQTATVDELCAFSAEVWDFRRQADGSSVERNKLQDLSSPEVAELVDVAAVELGLKGHEIPTLDQYDHVLILGGLIRASLLRPAFANELIENGLTAGTVAAIGGYRELRDDELEIREAAGMPSIGNEVDAMDYGLRTAFSLDDAEMTEEGELQASDLNRSWLVRKYDRRTPPNVILVAAPSTDPEVRRANTPDTYKYWAEELVELKPSDRVLLVTSAIYVPFQGLDALRMLSLPYRCGIETVGLPAGRTALGVAPQVFTPSHYLQEVNSTLRSIRFALREIS